MNNNFFFEQFEGPTAQFSVPHVTCAAIHPYTEEMITTCLRTIATNRQSRITRNCRIYVDGMMISPFTAKEKIKQISDFGSIQNVDWEKVFDGKEFLIFINFAALYSPDMLAASKIFLGNFDQHFGQVGISIEHHIIIGRYTETSFGVHIDDATDRVFHFNLGPHSKNMDLWPRRDFLARYDGDLARPRRTVQDEPIATYIMPVGSAFFLPADYHHVGSSLNGVSVVAALAFSRQNETLLLKEAMQELRQLVSNDRNISSYYTNFASGSDEIAAGLLERYDQVGIRQAARHAIARRRSNRSFAEVPELIIPSLETLVGCYSFTGTPVEIVEVDAGAYVYSGGHRAVLSTISQVHDIRSLLDAEKFEITQVPTADSRNLALRAWLVATGAAQTLRPSVGER